MYYITYMFHLSRREIDMEIVYTTICYDPSSTASTQKACLPDVFQILKRPFQNFDNNYNNILYCFLFSYPKITYALFQI